MRVPTIADRRRTRNLVHHIVVHVRIPIRILIVICLLPILALGGLLVVAHGFVVGGWFVAQAVCRRLPRIGQVLLFAVSLFCHMPQFGSLVRGNWLRNRGLGLAIVVLRGRRALRLEIDRVCMREKCALVQSRSPHVSQSQRVTRQ